jgi:hypothetical protein
VKALPNPAPISSWCALADQAGLHGVAVKAGYEANGGGFNNAQGRLRTLELVQGARPDQGQRQPVRCRVMQQALA